MLSKNDIRKLVDKYLMGDTSLEEERLLKEYFCSARDIPKEWLAYAVLFNGFANKGSIQKVRGTKKVYPWIAAASVAVLIVVCLMPSRSNTDVSPEQGIAFVENDAVQQNQMTVDEESKTSIDMIQEEVPAKPKIQKPVITHDSHLVAQTESSIVAKTDEEITSENDNVLAENNLSIEERLDVKPQPRTLTDRDLPVTRPENLKYTKEELALMKKQANEAYLKWVELELEIAKYNIEQTAQR